MPKATLEFDLPEDIYELRNCLNGSAWKGLVEEIYNYYRNIQKHGNGSEQETAGEIKDMICRAMNDRGLDFE